MTKKEFTNEVARRMMLTEYVVEEVFNVSSELTAEKLIAGEDVELPKMGKFVLSSRKATTYKNLLGESPEKKSELVFYPLFKISNALKKRVKNGQKYNKTS